MYEDIVSEQLLINTNGSYLLIAWAVLNIISGITLSVYFKKRSVLKNFFLFNALWNIINLLIGIGSIYSLSTINSAEIDLKELIYKMFTVEKLLLFNAGLDLAYIAIGSYMVERGLHRKSERLQGFGRSMWLQGGFLFLFDIVFYYINTMYNQRYSIFILF
jgi:hypothetical protein